MTDDTTMPKRYGRSTSGTATVALLLALAALVAWPFSAMAAGALGIIAAIAALIARGELKRSAREAGFGLSLAAFIIGSIVAIGTLAPLVLASLVGTLSGL